MAIIIDAKQDKKANDTMIIATTGTISSAKTAYNHGTMLNINEQADRFNILLFIVVSYTFITAPG
jgi:hypothetical protein